MHRLRVLFAQHHARVLRVLGIAQRNQGFLEAALLIWWKRELTASGRSMYASVLAEKEHSSSRKTPSSWLGGCLYLPELEPNPPLLEL